MRYLFLVVVQVILFSSLAFAAPTVFLKDGTTAVGNSIWIENSTVYLSQQKVIYEFGPDEVKLEETLKYNKLGRYQVVIPDTRDGVSASVVSTPRRTKKTSVRQAGLKSENSAAAFIPAPSVVPSVAVPAPVAATPAPISAPPAAAAPAPAPAPAPTVQVPAPPVAAPSVPAAVQISSGFPIAFLLIILAVSILLVVAYWVIYERAGRAGWKSLIPFYNIYVLMEISGKPGWWMFLLFIPLVGVVIYFLAMLSLAKKFGRSELFGVGIFLLPMIFLPLLAFGDSQYEG